MSVFIPESKLTAKSIFASSAVEMARFGLGVIPVSVEKEPYIKGFSNFRYRPSIATVSKWADKHPEANIAIIPGLSGVAVADVDDVAQERQVENLLGKTPLKAKSSRGIHLYYKSFDRELPTDLRPFGLDVDLKTGNSIVIAPPSIHKSGKVYKLVDGCGWETLGEVPQADLRALEDHLARNSNQALLKTRQGYRSGSRNRALNDWLFGQLGNVDDEESLLDLARTRNESQWKHFIIPLEDEEVVKVVGEVWRTRDNFVDWRVRSEIKISEAEMMSLMIADKHGGDAVILLLHLRKCHSARCKKGETFNITPVALTQAQVIPGWTKPTYERARDILLNTGLIKRTREYGLNEQGELIGSQYVLGDRFYGTKDFRQTGEVVA